MKPGFFAGWRGMAAVALVLPWTLCASSHAADPLRVALIEPYSGPFASTGTTALRAFQGEFDRLNAAGGALGQTFTVVPFDSKSSAQEAALQVQAAADQGIRIIIQGSGSNVAHAVSDFVAKYNARNPDKPLLYLNHGALDPALTEEKCHFWHFRFVAHGHMIMTGVIDALARQKDVKRVYLVNQDYAWGHSVARDARQMLKERRPDIEIVGEDLHPMGKVKDFAPYAAKIRAANANALVTGNWGNDLSLLVKALDESGSRIRIHAPIAGLNGTAASMGASGAGRVHGLLFWHANAGDSSLLTRALAFRARYGEDWNWLPNHTVPEMLVRAMTAARSTDVLKVALALESMRHEGPTGEVWMRAEDHQLMMPLFETVFARQGDPGVRYDAEGSGYGWKTERRLEARDTVPPVLCRVDRPG